MINSSLTSKRLVIQADDFAQSSVHIRSMATQFLSDQLNSLDLIERIISLADTAVADDVKALLEKILIKKVPELLFMGLLQIDVSINKGELCYIYLLDNIAYYQFRSRRFTISIDYVLFNWKHQQCISLYKVLESKTRPL